jgi:hypothetical protein
LQRTSLRSLVGVLLAGLKPSSFSYKLLSFVRDASRVLLFSFLHILFLCVRDVKGVSCSGSLSACFQPCCVHLGGVEVGISIPLSKKTSTNYNNI